MASGDTYDSWGDRDSASQGERGYGYFGSQSDHDSGGSSDLDRSSTSLPAQRGSYGSGSFGDSQYDDSYRGGSHATRHDPRSEIYGDSSRSDPYSSGYGGERRDLTGTHPAVTDPPSTRDVFKRSGGGFKSWPGWARFLTAIGVLVVALVVTHLFFFQAYSVPSSAMAPTMQAGDRVLVSKIAYDFRSPKRGEIVLFQGSSKWTPEVSGDSNSGIFSAIGSTVGSWVGISSPDSDQFFRRVIAVPGDTIACCDLNGHVTVNGKPLNETYVVNDSPTDVSNAPACGSRLFNPVVVSPGNVFVMGDNRVASIDSRCVAQVPINKIVGRATAMVWSSWGSLPIPSTFKDVPKPYGLGPVSRVPTDDGAGLVIVAPLLVALAGRRVFRPLASRKARAQRP